MPQFTSFEDLYDVMTPFYQLLVSHPEVGPKFVSSDTSFRLRHENPEAVFMIDATQDPAVLTFGDEAGAGNPAIELTMSADDGHQFWLGKMNLPIALARRKVKVSGNVASMLGLLPALQPAYELYRKHLGRIGRSATS